MEVLIHKPTIATRIYFLDQGWMGFSNSYQPNDYSFEHKILHI